MLMHWATIFSALGIIQGLFLIIILHRVRDRNKSANKFLIAFLALITLTMIGRLLATTTFFSTLPSFFAFPDAIIFLYGPFLYFYIHRLLFSTLFNFKKRAAHFIPVTLFLIIQTLRFSAAKTI